MIRHTSEAAAERRERETQHDDGGENSRHGWNPGLDRQHQRDEQQTGGGDPDDAGATAPQATRVSKRCVSHVAKTTSTAIAVLSNAREMTIGVRPSWWVTNGMRACRLSP